MTRLSSVFGAVALLAVAGPLPARACTTDADCDNGNVCDGVEYCQAGVCFNRPPLVCDDSDPCTQNTCDPTLGCQFPATAGWPEPTPGATDSSAVSSPRSQRWPT